MLFSANRVAPTRITADYKQCCAMWSFTLLPHMGATFWASDRMGPRFDLRSSVYKGKRALCHVRIIARGRRLYYSNPKFFSRRYTQFVLCVYSA